jgi:hypothetical protein
VLQAASPAIPVAAAEDAPGAKAALAGGSLQESARAVRPDPQEAKDDRSKVYDDGCLAAQDETTTSPCVYGDPDGDVTVVAYGDSKMMQYAVALDTIGRREGWRVVVLTKSGCPPAGVLVHNDTLRRPYVECTEWRRQARERIAAEDPDAVLLSGRATYSVIADGKRLGPRESSEALERGWEEEIRRLHAIDAQLVVIEDNPHPATDVPACVAQEIDDLTRCATPEKEARADTFVATHVASRFPDVELIDPAPVLCTDGLCPAVIGNVIVYRDASHLSATFVETLTDWLGEQLLQRLA